MCGREGVGRLGQGAQGQPLLGSAELVQGAPVSEVALRAGAAKSLVLDFTRVGEQLKVDRAPIRALTKALGRG